MFLEAGTDMDNDNMQVPDLDSLDLQLRPPCTIFTKNKIKSEEKEMRNYLFSENMKMADLILIKPSIILLLPRFNIPLGFGDKSVKDLCMAHGISSGLFLMICNIYSFDNYVPSQDVVNSIDMSMLDCYLEKSHRYYLDQRLPHIANHISRIAGEMNNRAGEILKCFFEEYNNEVIAHFRYEEQNVFPHLNRLLSGEVADDYSITAYLPSHTNIEDKLDDLTQIMFKYLPEGVKTYETIGAVFDILQLSEDLKKHSLIEEKVLIPFVEHLEKIRGK